MVCSTDRSKAVVPVLVLLFVALWFILRGDLLYVFPCVTLFLFSVLLVLRLPRLGKRELILVLFVRLFGLCLFGFVGFLFLLGSGKVCGLWLWHSQDFSLTCFVMLCYDVDENWKTTNVEPNYKPHYAAYDVGLHCLLSMSVRSLNKYNTFFPFIMNDFVCAWLKSGKFAIWKGK